MRARVTATTYRTWLANNREEDEEERRGDSEEMEESKSWGSVCKLLSGRFCSAVSGRAIRASQTGRIEAGFVLSLCPMMPRVRANRDEQREPADGMEAQASEREACDLGGG